MTMWILLISILLASVAIALIKKRFSNNDTQTNSSDCTDCSICNSNNDGCMHEKIMAKATEEPEYFDDEELDNFKGREADDYSADETSMFANVLYTMRQNEVADWLISLEKRGINLPVELRDEALMLIDN